jgi:simple sugar transport system permease protein
VVNVSFQPASVRWLDAALIPVLSVVLALVVGAVIILITGGDPVLAYRGLFDGAFTRPNAISETLVWTTPYIYAGLAVTLGFKAGLFNIGGEGQLGLGALATALVGYAVKGVPWPFHLILAILAGALVGGLWAAIPGYLKARYGAHEVINTIMLNYVALLLSNYLLSGPMKDPNRLVAVAQTPKILDSAKLPTLFAGTRLHWGFPLALLMAVLVYVLLRRTTLGFEIRAVGLNPSAARAAGISVERTIVVTMFLSGALAGLAGAIEVVGVDYYQAASFSVGYGFDSIAIALLGKTDPLGLVPAAILFGALRSGATRMQFLTQIPVDVIGIIQGLVLVFVAADAIVRWLFRFPRRGADTPLLASAITPASASDG